LEENKSLTLLYETGFRLSQTLDVGQVYAVLYDLLKQAMECDELIISAYDNKTQKLTCEYYRSRDEEIDPDRLPQLSITVDSTGAQSKVIRSGKSMIIPNYHLFMRNSEPKANFDTGHLSIEGKEFVVDDLNNRSAILVPIRLEGEVVGVVQIFSYRFNAYSERDFRLAEGITNQVAVARNNASLYQRAQQELMHRRKLQQELEAQQAVLEQRVVERTESLAQALSVRDEFLANMSREIRSPLTAIQGLSELLQFNVSGENDEKQGRYAKLIYQNSLHLMQMLNDILDMSRVASGEMTVHKEWVSMDSLCRACLLYTEGRAIEKNIKVVFTQHTELDRIYVDPPRTKQLLNYVLNNAVKFTPHGQSIGFEVAVSNDLQWVEFIIWDQGVGIAKSDQETLFQPFQHMPTGFQEENGKEGMGLGLVLTKRLLELQGGKIEFRSQPDLGTLVAISLPLNMDAKDDGHGHTTLLTPAQTGMLHDMKTRMRNVRILLADSDEATTELLGYYLEIFNVEPIVVRSTRDARLALRNEEFHMMILDIFIQGDVEKLLHDIRGTRKLYKLPIIATYSVQSDINEEMIRSYKINDLLKKPYQFSEIISKIRKYLS